MAIIPVRQRRFWSLAGNIISINFEEYWNTSLANEDYIKMMYVLAIMMKPVSKRHLAGICRVNPETARAFLESAGAYVIESTEKLEKVYQLNLTAVAFLSQEHIQKKSKMTLGEARALFLDFVPTLVREESSQEGPEEEDEPAGVKPSAGRTLIVLVVIGFLIGLAAAGLLFSRIGWIGIFFPAAGGLAGFLLHLAAAGGGAKVLQYHGRHKLEELSMEFFGIANASFADAAVEMISSGKLTLPRLRQAFAEHRSEMADLYSKFEIYGGKKENSKKLIRELVLKSAREKEDIKLKSFLKAVFERSARDGTVKEKKIRIKEKALGSVAGDYVEAVWKLICTHDLGTAHIVFVPRTVHETAPINEQYTMSGDASGEYRSGAAVPIAAASIKAQKAFDMKIGFEEYRSRFPEFPKGNVLEVYLDTYPGGKKAIKIVYENDPETNISAMTDFKP